MTKKHGTLRVNRSPLEGNGAFTSGRDEAIYREKGKEDEEHSTNVPNRLLE